jgi:dihydrofolate synthase/folylpolyglutamate synthase
MITRQLSDWLSYIERIHPSTIDLGLDRVRAVKDAMGLSSVAALFTVGGTNGKGSTCALLEAILLAAGYRVGLYTSPHLRAYNERVRINGKDADDARLCDAFERVEQARAAVDTSLTYFEFGTLAAWDIFAREKLDVVILEVGLGGRLDAVNVFDPDCAILTNVALDHMDYLGDTREKIGAEKAGIFRSGRPAIVAEPRPPETVLESARGIGADLRLLGRDFGFSGDKQQWQFWGRDGRRFALPHPALRGANQLLNASAALAALETVRERLPLSAQAIRTGLVTAHVPGRLQVLPGRPVVVLDVAHNPHAAAVLSDNLLSMGFFQRTFAVFGMLRDKDIAGVVKAMKGRVTEWFLAALGGPRGTSADRLREALLAEGVQARIELFDSPCQAFAAARKEARENDRIVVFGSFYTVGEVLDGQGSSPGTRG